MTVASVLGQLVQGSLASDAALERSREGYEPGAPGPGAQADMVRWSTRMTRQSELATAREIAGLSDAELSALAREFTLWPRRRRTELSRFATPAGVLLFFAGLMGLMLQEASLGVTGRGMLSAFEVICLGALASGLIAVAYATMKAFSMTSVDLAYGQVGLYAGVLDEQHPWLYKTYLLMRNGAAQEYRERTLRQRGALRGVDCVLMREIARADEERVLTMTSRWVAAQVQAGVPAASERDGEPRLTLVESSLNAAA
jgi:hypothetical protein